MHKRLHENRTPGGEHAPPATSAPDADDLNFDVLLHAMPYAVVIVNDAGTITIVNGEAVRLFGYTEQELIGQPIEVLIPPTLRARHQEQRAEYGVQPHTRPMGADLDIVAQRKDGGVFPVEVSLSPIRTAAGLLVMSVVRDISERKLAEVALRRSEALLSGIVGIAEDAIISINDQQQITMFNQGAEKIFGYSAADVIGQPLGILLPEQFRAVHREHIARFARASEQARPMGQRLEILGRRKNGRTFPAEASISKLLLGEHMIFNVILRDITERKAAADLLERQVQSRTAHLNALLQFSNELLVARRSEDVLRRALNHAQALVPEAQRGVIYLYDSAGDRLALRASFGYEQLPLLALPTNVGVVGAAFTEHQPIVFGTVAERERLMVHIDSADAWRALGLHEHPTGVAAIPLMTFGAAIGVLVLLRETGQEPFAADARQTLVGLANLTAAAIMEEQSQQQAATLTTQLAALEEQQRAMTERLNSVESGMLQAARLAAVGQLAASIAHEINNPLYAARNGLYLIEEDLPPDLRDSPYFKMVSDQLTRIAGIIERMRDFYRPMRGDLMLYDLNQLLEETLALAGLNVRHGSVQIIFTPARDLQPVLCNGDQLRQVFLNLVLNAIEAMPAGGTLTVRTIAGPTVAIVEVQDTGIGIPDDIRPHLFEPFFTNKSNGTGLGLSISAHIVTQHGGQIEVESAQGVGSTFRVVLPYTP